MAFDINSLTLGEIAKAEDLSGQPVAALADDDKPKGLALAALAFVVKRRTDPKFTWNDAQALTFTEAQHILGLDDTPSPADEDAHEHDVREEPDPKGSKS